MIKTAAAALAQALVFSGALPCLGQSPFIADRMDESARVLVQARDAARATPPAKGARVGYAGLPISKVVSKVDITRALQAMMDSAYGVGFRTIGHPDDWFHGHFLFDGNQVPRAILYHTQERAGLYRLYEPGSRFDYVDENKRNWIQRLPDLKAEDARAYRVSGTKPQWCSEDEAFTVSYEMLDPAKIGFTPVIIGEFYQFNFYQTPCKGREKDADSRVASVIVDGKPVCLEFNDDASKRYSANFFKLAKKLGDDQKKGKHRSSCP
ncbi:MAG: hypothetical protein HY077_06020 [Elusimicrobia bacterium]|nr:hypothetical protein [Elusimicrobiota bacterium]